LPLPRFTTIRMSEHSVPPQTDCWLI
jgi:hypothetical protein